MGRVYRQETGGVRSGAICELDAGTVNSNLGQESETPHDRDEYLASNCTCLGFTPSRSNSFSLCGDQADGPCLCRHQSSYQISVSVDEVLDTQGNRESEGQLWVFGWDGNTVWRVNVPAGTTVNNPHDMGEGWSVEITVPFADMGLEGHLDGRTIGSNVPGMN